MDLILILKGFLIGVGKIIPGVSGSLIAITLGIYDKMLGSVSNFFKDIKENIKFLGLLGIGIILAVILTSKLLTFLLNKYYIITMLFFIGLIIGGIPSQIKKTKLKFNKNIFFGILSFLLIIGIFFIKKESNIIKNYSYFTMFLIGILDAFTMIVPGVSGTAIMMLLGCYSTILNMFSNIYLIDNLKKGIPFFFGIVLGIIFISKLIYFCFNNYKEQTNYAIIGFTVSSSLLLFINIIGVNGTIFTYLIGLFFFMLGCKVSSVLEKY